MNGSSYPSDPMTRGSVRLPSSDEQAIWRTWVGKQVKKISGKPFKSGSKVNTVKNICIHPKLLIMAFEFHEDSSLVECRRCLLE